MCGASDSRLQNDFYSLALRLDNNEYKNVLAAAFRHMLLEMIFWY